MTLRTQFLVAAALPLLLAGCFPRVGPAPGPLTAADLQAAQARDAAATPEALEQGRQLFLDHCDKCHGYAALAPIPEDKWRTTVPRMGQKAKISSAQAKLVLDFVLAARPR